MEWNYKELWHSRDDAVKFFLAGQRLSTYHRARHHPGYHRPVPYNQVHAIWNVTTTAQISYPFPLLKPPFPSHV